MPSCAVTTVVIVLGPTARGRFPVVVPDTIPEPFTVSVALLKSAVGVILMDVVVLPTEAA